MGSRHFENKALSPSGWFTSKRGAAVAFRKRSLSKASSGEERLCALAEVSRWRGGGTQHVE